MENIKVGDSAKDFQLKDQNGNEHTLSQYKGKRILLSFHPLAWTDICAKQMKSLEDNKKAMDTLNTMALGLSVDSVPCKKAWAESLGIQNTPLLSDFWPHGSVAEEYGIFLDDRGISSRTNIIVNEDQKVVFVKIYEIKQLPDINEILDFIGKL
jgi:peroxiredoxin